MMNRKILSTATSLPPVTKSTPEIMDYVEGFLMEAGMDERFRQKVLRIFRYAGVDRRYAIMEAEEVFGAMDFQDRNDLYKEWNCRLSREVLEKALEVEGISGQEIYYIITVSCTGFMIPSVDAYLINSLGLKQDIVRLPVTEMGCVGGVSGLIYADQFLKGEKNKKAAVVAFEAPSATFQDRDFSMTNMVSAAIFGDGAAAAIVGESEEVRPTIVDHSMYHFFDETEMMGYNVVNTGFEMVLDVRVPEKIEAQFEDILESFLDDNGLTLQDIDHFIFHPGGKKIVRMAEEALGKYGKDIHVTKEVLRKYGNMSSATVLFVLDEFMQRDIQAGERGLMLSFGPGFTAQRILLEWK